MPRMDELYDDLVNLCYELRAGRRRLAELLSQGLTPEACALRLRVSINTIRSQLRALFRKTETERQSELINLFARVQGI